MNKLFLAFVVLTAFPCAQAIAGTETFQLHSSVDRECIISTTTANNGQFLLDPFLDSEQSNVSINHTAVNVKCTLYSTAAEGASHLVTVRYSEGLHADAGSTCDAPLRRMKSTTSNTYISYRLTPSSVALKDKEFGCGTKYTSSLTSALNGFVDQVAQQLDFDQYANPKDFVFYFRSVAARVAPEQNMLIGTYTDTITVTVEF